MIRCRLSEFMGKKKLTKQDVINATGLSRVTVSNLYAETAGRIDYDTIEKLCRFFECEIGEMFYLDRSVSQI